MSATPDRPGTFRAIGILHDRFAPLCPFLLMAIPPAVANWPEYRGLVAMLGWPGTPILLLCWGCLVRITLYLAENRQRKLRQTWGGRPGVRMLRHGDRFFSSKTKRILHERLRRKGCGSMPSPESERLDPQHADDTYTFALAHCDHRFRDRITFRELWQKRTVYEFLLNCVALRWLGLASCIVTLLSSCTRPPRMSIATTSSDVDLALLLAFDRISPWVIVVSLVMMWAWAFFFTPERLHTAARSLDYHILECLAAKDTHNGTNVSPRQVLS